MLLNRSSSRSIATCSLKSATAEARNRRAHLRGTFRRDPIASDLRRELYEAHRLIDGLGRRFPETVVARTLTR